MGKRIYVAGPMRNIKEFNFPSFFLAEEKLTRKGWKVVNPARHDIEEYGLDVTGLTGDMDELNGFDLNAALKWDMKQICDADAIFMLRGWEHSSGARAEHALASALNHQILYE